MKRKTLKITSYVAFIFALYNIFTLASGIDVTMYKDLLTVEELESFQSLLRTTTFISCILNLVVGYFFYKYTRLDDEALLAKRRYVIYFSIICIFFSLFVGILGFMSTGKNSTQNAIANRLLELEKLHREGLITDEEYERKKDDILNQL